MQRRPEELVHAIREFQSLFHVADEDFLVTARLLDLLQTRVVQGKQIHDANIVATMLRNNVRRLLTHNYRFQTTQG